MVDEPEEKTTTDENSPEEEQSPAKKGGMMKYILFGGIGLAVMAAAIFGTLMFLGGDDTAHEETTDESSEVAEGGEQSSHGSKDNSHALEADLPPGFSGEEDPTVLDDIMANLEFLDYQPEATGVEAEDEKLSVDDSLEAVNWLEQEKTKLAETETRLQKWQKDLDVLDKKVSQKILRLEQAESTRIAALAKLYDGMDSRAVAKLIANLDDETVVSILPRMKQKNASQLMALMPAKRAARLSKLMITLAEN
ncbi:MAG: hypothetical protein V3T31_04525 [candidate division Zixibacteria bacterium]